MPPDRLPPDQPRILILGGGFGGLFAARRLSRLLAGRAAIELVDEQNYFVFQPLLPEVAAGTLDSADALSPFRLLLRGVRTTEGEVVGIDFIARTVEVVRGEVVQGMRRHLLTLPWDHLVIALGQKTDLSRLPGLAEHALGLRDLADAFTLRNHVIDCLEQADVETDRDLKRRVLTFVVVGGGLSGVETIGEIETMIARALPSYPGIRRGEVRLVLAEHAPRLLPELPARLAAYATRALGRRGIEVITGAGVKAAARDAVELADGTLIPTQTLVATIGNAPSPLIQRLPLPKERGRIVTDAVLRVSGFESVWALGDVAWIVQPDGVVPPTAQAAAQAAETLARNVAAVLDGGTPRPFVFRSKGQVASLGGRRGVAELFGRQLTGWPAWVLWRSAYLAMLPGFAAKVRVALDWMLDALFPRNLVQIHQPRPRAVRRVRFRKGDVVFARGDFAGPLYLVEDGRFARTPDPGDGRTEIGPGGHFGEAAVKGERIRRTTVRALEDSTCLVVRQDDFDTIAACLAGLEGVRAAGAG